MGSYGIGPGRVMGTIAEVFNDQDGLTWPESVAPYLVHLIDLREKNDDSLYKILQKHEIEVIYDDREISAGIKLKDADLIGIPYRLVLSDKLGNDKVELKKRNEDNIKICSFKEVIKILN